MTKEAEKAEENVSDFEETKAALKRKFEIDTEILKKRHAEEIEKERALREEERNNLLTTIDAANKAIDGSLHLVRLANRKSDRLEAVNQKLTEDLQRIISNLEPIVRMIVSRRESTLELLGEDFVNECEVLLEVLRPMTEQK